RSRARPRRPPAPPPPARWRPARGPAAAPRSSPAPEPHLPAHLGHGARRGLAGARAAALDRRVHLLRPGAQLLAAQPDRREVLDDVVGEPGLAVDAADAGGGAAGPHPLELLRPGEEGVQRV